MRTPRRDGIWVQGPDGKERRLTKWEVRARNPHLSFEEAEQLAEKGYLEDTEPASGERGLPVGGIAPMRAALIGGAVGIAVLIAGVFVVREATVTPGTSDLRATNEAGGTPFTSSGRLGDEVMRHVVDECDLYRTYQRNRIDFDPVEVGVSILPEMRRSRTDWQFLRNSIHDTVEYEQSFYRRSLMYNTYYQLCIQRIGTSESERSILEIRVLPVDPNITAADSTVRSLYDTVNDASRVRRDQAKIEILRFIEAGESDPIIQRKIQSVIQEIVYDIELWQF